MSALNAIRSLIASMKSEEIKVARNFLKAFSTRGAESRNLSLELFDLLLNENKTGEIVASDKIEFFLYGNYHNAGYVSLVIRLLEKIEESLLLEVNLNRKGNHSEQARELYNVRKQISLAQIVYYRGCVDHAITLFQSALKTADKFEFFEQYSEAARYYMQVLLFNESIKEYQNIKIKHDKAIRAIQGIKKAEYYYNMLSYQLQFSAVGVGVASLERQISELNFELTQTRTATVAYYLTFLETQYYQEQKKYKLSAQTLKEQIRLIEHPALYSDNAKGLSLLNLGWNEIYLLHLKQGEKIILEAIKYFKSDSQVAVSQCHLALFYIYYYLGNTEKALSELDLISNNENIDRNASFKKGKIDFLRASTYFTNQQFEETKIILRDLNPIESDSEGWNIQVRILHIINDIELGALENAFNRLENFRKHIEKLNRKAEQQPRVLIIFDILRTLGNTNFDFPKTRQKKQSELNELKSEIASWEILSPELIIFDQWFESKVFKKSYQHLIPTQKSKSKV